jgi:hypothetical protein
MSLNFESYNNPDAGTVWVWQSMHATPESVFVQQVEAESKQEAAARIAWEMEYDSVEEYFADCLEVDTLEELFEDPTQRLVREDELSRFAIHGSYYAGAEQPGGYIRTVDAKDEQDAKTMFAWTEGYRSFTEMTEDIPGAERIDVREPEGPPEDFEPPHAE